VENIAPALLEWFYKNQRILPFRTDPSPYHVWLSEIMLQQTRVSAALPYYERFLAALPDIPALAACEEEKLHKLWEGLGYYSRVRNLQKAARIVCEQYGGQPTMTPSALCPVSGITRREPSRPSASGWLSRRWTEMCCGCFPDCIMTLALLQNRR
jgi:adenine-specific DNA glycosylase